MVKSEIRKEHLSSTLAIVRRVITSLETSTPVQLIAQKPRWFQLVEIIVAKWNMVTIGRILRYSQFMMV